MIVLDLIHNIALLVALSAAYQVLIARLRQDSLAFQALTGLLFGSVGVIGMMTPVHFSPGIIFDGRTIILSIAGLFGGPLVAAVAAAPCAAYRLWLAGGGAAVGVATILEAAGLGVFFHYFVRRRQESLSVPFLWGFSLLVHLVMLGLFLFLPGGAGAAVIQQLGLTMILLYPVASVLVSLFILEAEAKVRSRQALQRSEAALRKAQQVARLGTWTWRLDKDQVELSGELLRIFGLEEGAFSGKLDEFAALVHPEDRQAFLDRINSLSAATELTHLEFRLQPPAGSERWIWAEAGEMLLDKKGQPAALMGVAQDITALRAAERELRESEARYRSLVMNSPDAIFINLDDRIVLVNHECLRLFGASQPEDLLGKTPYDLFDPSFHDQIRERIRCLRETGEPVPVAEERILRLDGQAVDVDVIAAPFSFQGSSAIHVILRDITARKRMEAALRGSYELLSKLAEQVPGVVYQYRWFPDGSSCFPYASPGIEEIYEVTPEEVRQDAAPVFSRLHPDDHDRIVQEIRESARTLGLFHSEFRVVLPRQGLRWRACNAKPERLEDGSVLWHGIISDITDRKLAEQQINEQLAELRRWHSLLLGREKRVIELKQEVNELLAQAGKPPRYAAELIAENAQKQGGGFFFDAGRQGAAGRALAERVERGRQTE